MWYVECSRKTSLGYVTISEEGGSITGLKFVDTGSVSSNAALDDAFVQLEEYLSKERKEFDLRYRLVGTEFQMKAWNFLRTIPYGKTSTYHEEAVAIGCPRSDRAVGSANGRNPIAIFIPCHRVIRTDGTLGGYAFGLDIKKKLLELEGA